MIAIDIRRIYGDGEDKEQKRLRKKLYEGESPYFRGDLIIFHNFDIYRSTDIMICVIVFLEAMLFLHFDSVTFFIASV